MARGAATTSDDPRHLRQHPAQEPTARRRRGAGLPSISGGRPQTSIYDASAAYKAAGVPLVSWPGRIWQTGSSRDWAAKGKRRCFGVKAVIAESYETHPNAPTRSVWACSRCSIRRARTPSPWACRATATFAITGGINSTRGRTPRRSRSCATCEDGSSSSMFDPRRGDDTTATAASRSSSWPPSADAPTQTSRADEISPEY